MSYQAPRRQGGSGRGGYSGGGGSGACFKCGQLGHFARDCSSSTAPAPRSARAPAPAAASSSTVTTTAVYKTPYIDTHCHVDYMLSKTRVQTLAEFYRQRPLPANYAGCISVFCDPSAFSPSLGNSADILAAPLTWGAFGMHPHNAKYYTPQMEARIKELLAQPKALAWGEIGLDYNRMNSPVDVQRDVFARQIKCALAVGKPIVVHSRDAAEDTFRILSENAPKDMKIHLHCFSDTPAMAARYVNAFPNLCIGITGVITWGSGKAQNLVDAVRDAIPLDRLLLETDAPYMSTEGGKGAICHSGMIPAIAEVIANLKGVSPEDVFAAARANTTKIYGIQARDCGDQANLSLSPPEEQWSS